MHAGSYIRNGEMAIHHTHAMMSHRGGVALFVAGTNAIWWGSDERNARGRARLSLRRRDALRRWREKHGEVIRG